MTFAVHTAARLAPEKTEAAKEHHARAPNLQGGDLPRWLESGRRYPLTDARRGLELPGLAGQEFALLARRQRFDSLFDAVRFLRQALLERGFGLVGLGAQHG